MTKTEIKSWQSASIEIDVRRLLGVHKYKDITKVRPVIIGAAEKAIQTALEICVPQAIYTTVNIHEIGKEGILLKDNVLLNCKAFHTKMAGSDQLLVFVITLGAELDAAVARGFADGTDPLGPLFLDTAGWLMVEAATRAFSQKQKESFAEFGQKLSARMAPGYDYPLRGTDQRVGWDLYDQVKLFGLFKGEDLPVELLESGGMIPRMSRSGAFGVRTAT